MATVDLTAVKQHLNITDSTQDVELTKFINAVLLQVTAFVGPLSGTASGRVVSDGTVLVLPTMPIQSVESLTNTLDNTTALTISDYDLDKDAGLMYGVPAGTYEVSYTAGWAVLPEDLALDILDLIKLRWSSQRGTARIGQTPETAPNMPGAYTAILERLKATHAPSKVV